jgi:hypothetical protein
LLEKKPSPTLKNFREYSYNCMCIERMCIERF